MAPPCSATPGSTSTRAGSPAPEMIAPDTRVGQAWACRHAIQSLGAAKAAPPERKADLPDDGEHDPLEENARSQARRSGGLPARDHRRVRPRRAVRARAREEGFLLGQQC